MNESTSLLITLSDGARLIRVAIKFDYALPYTLDQMVRFWGDEESKEALMDFIDSTKQIDYEDFNIVEVVPIFEVIVVTASREEI